MPEVRCFYCGKLFFKSTGRFNEAKKFNWNFYCSSECLFSNFRKRVFFICENKSCGKKFERLESAISKHNFCSSSCAAIFNNHKRFAAYFKTCKICQGQYKGANFYCSIPCAKEGRRGYKTEELLDAIKTFYDKNGRVPARREVMLLQARCQRAFGSWTKAILAAGLQPNRSDDQRMYKRTMTKAKDGHLCDSISEAIIDNWLTQNKIAHRKDVQYPSSKHKADWILSDGTYVEYFGLAKDSPRYDRDIKIKQELCNKLGIKLVAMYPQDLYSQQNYKE